MAAQPSPCICLGPFIITPCLQFFKWFSDHLRIIISKPIWINITSQSLWNTELNTFWKPKYITCTVFPLPINFIILLEKPIYQIRLFKEENLRIYLGICHVFCISIQHVSTLPLLFKIIYIITTIGKLECCLLIWIYKRVFFKTK